MKINKNSKFYIKPTFKERLFKFKNTVLYSIFFWKGRSKGIIHTRNLKWDDFRYIVYPKGFEKYGYLGTYLYDQNGIYFQALLPLILALDYEAKPKLCPRWFLRFLHVFGSDKSIVRVRNWTLHNLLNKLTKGISFVDWKTKWQDFDLRISINGPKYLQNLADDIERGFYFRGRQEEIIDQIKILNPNASIIRGDIKSLEKQLKKLESN